MARIGRVSKDEVVRREAEVWELRAQMLPYSQIAERVGITVAGVSKIVKRVIDRITDETDEVARQIRADHLARYDYIYREAVISWQASKSPKKKQTVTSKKAGKKGGTTPDGEPDKWVDEVRTGSMEDGYGDVSYLQLALSAMGDAQKLAGIADKSEVEHKIQWYSTLPSGVSRNEAEAMMDEFASILANAATKDN